MIRTALTAIPIAIAFCTFTFPSSACQVPVFRYALEHWSPDPFEAVVLYRDELSEDQQALVQKLRDTASKDRQSRANIKVVLLDANIEKPKEYETQIIDEYANGELPQTLLYFPAGPEVSELIWSGPLNEDNISALVESPARATIAERLLGGQSAVWVLLESGDVEKDNHAARILTDELSAQSEKIHLPSLQELATEEKFNQEIDVELRVEFSIIRVSREDAKEAVFRDMLLASEPDLKDFDEPIAIPIFGRGRSYFALIGQGINSDTIEENCMFICGPCSCEAKRLNPGRDMLLTAYWDQITPRNWATDVPLPELTGVGAFETTAIADPLESTSANETAAGETENHKIVALADTSAAQVEQARVVSPDSTEDEAVTLAVDKADSSLEGSLLTILLGLGGVGLFVVLGVTLWLRAAKE